jgi:hypothetical protein
LGRNCGNVNGSKQESHYENCQADEKCRILKFQNGSATTDGTDYHVDLETDLGDAIVRVFLRAL